MNSKNNKSYGLISAKDSLLLIVDVQEKLMPVISNNDEVIANIVRLVKFANIINMPVIFTEQVKLGKTAPEIMTEHNGLNPIQKREFGCFSNDEFVNHIASLDVSTLIVAGVEAHVCISQTVTGALEKYNVHVVSDAVSSRTIQNRKVGLDRMQNNGAVITSTEMVIFELLKCAGTEEFREALRLVK